MKNETRLLQDRSLPMNVSAKCPACWPELKKRQDLGLIPADKGIETVYVAADKPLFGYRCVNRRCLEQTGMETLRCMLEAREFSLCEYTLTLGDELYLNPDGSPNVDHPAMEEHQRLNYGPFKICEGSLSYSGYRDETGATWLKCDRCSAIYKTFLFATYSLNKIVMHHQDFEMINKRDKWVIQKKQSNVVRSYNEVSSPVPLDWMLAITEIRVDGGLII